MRHAPAASRIAAVMLACVAPLSSLVAQDASGAMVAGISAGSRVRVATPDGAPFTGTLLTGDADTLVVQLPSGASLALPRTRVTRLEVSGGVRRHGWEGAGIGLLAGAGAGAAVALATYRRSDCGSSTIGQEIVCPLLDYTSRESTLMVDAALLGTAGTILGALIGHVGHETWIPVSRARLGDLHPRMKMRHVAGVMGIGVALDF